MFVASIEPRRNKNGIITSYRIKVLRGRDENGRQIFSTRSYPDKKRGESIPTGWSQKKIEKEVQRIATLFEEECKEGNVAVRKVKFKDYANECVDFQHKTGNLKLSSKRKYENCMPIVNNDIYGIGNMMIDEIQPHHINKFLSAMLNSTYKTPSGKEKKYCDSTVLKYKWYISFVLRCAKDENLIKENPCERATTIKVEATEKSAFMENELPYVLSAINTLPIKQKAIMYLLLLSGGRLGESLGLQWCNIDFENKTLWFHYNVQYNAKDGVYLEQTPKGRKERLLSVPQNFLDILTAYAEEYGILDLSTEDFVFKSEKTEKNGTGACSPSTVSSICYTLSNKRGIASKDFSVVNKYGETIEYHQGDIVNLVDINKMKDKSKRRIVIGNYRNQDTVTIDSSLIERMPHCNPHNFRHTYVSLLYHHDVDIVAISKNIGHSRVSTTQNYYSHTMATVDNRPAEFFESYLENLQRK